MTDTQQTKRKLLTREQVVDALRAECEEHGLSATARRYGLSPQQVNDVSRGNARLTERMWTHLGYVLREFFEKAGE